ncbi:MAG TPA: hypothetical protein PLD93_04125 [Synergistaceae bacterium]|nr:hypothetical protein [Synergistaceae bacterium]
MIDPVDKPGFLKAIVNMTLKRVDLGRDSERIGEPGWSSAN